MKNPKTFFVYVGCLPVFNKLESKAQKSLKFYLFKNNNSYANVNNMFMKDKHFSSQKI